MGIVILEIDIVWGLFWGEIFCLSENSAVITQGNWNVFFENNNGYKLNLFVPSSYLFGGILLCDNQVMFNDSYVDGSDYVYTKN